MRVHESLDARVASRGAVDARGQAGQIGDSRRTLIAPIRDGGLSLLVVDHDGPRLKNLVRILRANVRVDEVDTAVGAYRALLSASRRAYAGVFIDVTMPEVDGLEIISVLNAFAVPPRVVVVAESDTLVARAFRLGAVDYLMEPVTPERAEQALTRLEQTAARRQAGEAETDITPGTGDEAARENAVVVGGGRDGDARLLVPTSILYLQAYGDYMRVFADSGRYLIRGRLRDAALTLGADGFLRVHRRYVANLRRATEVQLFENGTALLRLDNQRQVPVARRHVHELRQRLRDELRPLGTTWHAASPVQEAPVP
jgi:DNA-binding LytR/AlgR family response regulator